MSQYTAVWPSGFSVVWRNLTWAEYKKIKSNYDRSPFLEPMDVALEIYKTVRIEGPDPKFVLAGIPAYICKQQMSNNPFSGRFEDISTALELSRSIVSNNYMLSAKGLIASTLNYKPEEIDNWEPNKFFLRLAQTELVLGHTLDPVDPKAAKEVLSKKPSRLSSAQQKAFDRSKQRDRARA